MMRAIVLKDKETLVMEDRPIPAATGSDVLVKVAFTGICGSDLTAYRSLTYPAGTIMGHEFAGIVHEVGPEVKNCKPGDRVVVRPCSVCFECPWCKEGRISQCPDHMRDTIGLDQVDGSFAEYCLVHDFQVFQMPDSMSFQDAAQIEPLACAVHAVEDSKIKESDRVLIIGTGTIGLLIFQVVKTKNPKEIVILEKSPFRRGKAECIGGAKVVSTPEELDEIVKNYPRRGFDIVIEAAGKKPAVEKAIQVVAKGGQLTIVGVCAEPVEINMFDLIVSGINITAIIGYFVEHWDLAMRLVAEGKIDFSQMVTGEYPLDRIEEGFRALLNPEKDLKILIRGAE